MCSWDAVEPERLVQALRRQRTTIEELLRESGVAPVDAEVLLRNAIGEIAEDLWTTAATLDSRLLGVIDRRCRCFAAALNRSYLGLKAHRPQG